MAGEFDLATGRALLDDKLRIRTFAARIVDGRVLVDLKVSSAPASAESRSRIALAGHATR